jgi:K(+)-stimulated pyrophosphate-energized sodium pump
MPEMGLVAPIAGAVGLFAALIIYLVMGKKPAGTEKMAAISEEIQLGALTFLKAEYTKIIIFVVLAGGAIAWGLGLHTAAAFLGGVVASGLAGFFGIRAATKGNVRSAAAAKDRGLSPAFSFAISSGAVTGLSVASMGLLALGVVFYFFETDTALPSIIIGISLGASTVALFARVAGGIFTKAADVGTDLVGKVEAGIPENDPRNPGVIADNVGDSIGDVGGVSADIFESYVGAVVASIAIISPLTPEFLAQNFAGVSKGMLLSLPLFLVLIGLCVSLLIIFCLQIFKTNRPGLALPLAAGLSKLLFAGVAGGVMFALGYHLNLIWAVMSGVGCALLINQVAGYYASSRPAARVAEAARTGAATNIISGFAVGLESTAAPMLLIALSVFASFEAAGFLGIALAAVGMISTVGLSSTLDSFSPIADNADGIAHMARLAPEVRAITATIDEAASVASTKSKTFATAAACMTSLALFIAFCQLTQKGALASLNTPDPRWLIGTFLGSLLVLLAAALTMKSVAKAAGEMVLEIRRQFKEIPGLLNGTGTPDTSRCVEISAQSALRQMIAPVVLVVAAPLAIGFGLGAMALAGAIMGAFITGFSFAFFMTNSGSIWGHAKRHIESGKIAGVGKGSEMHSASVIGDMVGDPFKDTTGPALNILVKLMAIVALAIAPFIT